MTPCGSRLLTSISLVVALLLWTGIGHAQSAREASGARELHDAIAQSDTALFESFNTCDLETFAAFFVENPEFYHDRTGLETSKASIVDSIRNNICGKVRRELVAGSLEVHPLPNFGALEIGAHRFYELARGKDAGPVGIAKFVHVWQKTSEGWKVSRVISYDHAPAE